MAICSSALEAYFKVSTRLLYIKRCHNRELNSAYYLKITISTFDFNTDEKANIFS